MHFSGPPEKFRSLESFGRFACSNGAPSVQASLMFIRKLHKFLPLDRGVYTGEIGNSYIAAYRLVGGEGVSGWRLVWDSGISKWTGRFERVEGLEQFWPFG